MFVTGYITATLYSPVYSDQTVTDSGSNSTYGIGKSKESFPTVPRTSFYSTNPPPEQGIGPPPNYITMNSDQTVTNSGSNSTEGYWEVDGELSNHSKIELLAALCPSKIGSAPLPKLRNPK
jgi:hypothetical protein